MPVRKPVASRMLRDDPLDASANSLGDSFSLFGIGGLGRGDAMVDNMVIESNGLAHFAILPSQPAVNDAEAAANVAGVTTIGDAAVTMTTPATGGIAFTALQSDNTGGGANGDFFQFVLLEAMTAGTTIFFTDNGYRTDTSTFRTNETMLRWVAQSDLPAGTLVSFTAPGGTGPANTAEWTGIVPSTGSAANTATFGLATGGDNITALISPTFGGAELLTGTPIAALVLATSFSATFTNTSGNASTGLPPGLTDGVNAVSVSVFDNAKYTGPATGTAAELRSAINTDTNWTANNTPLTPPGAAAFTLTGGAETQTVVFDPASVTLAEGNSGATLYSFTVTRTGGTTGDLTFSGTIAAGATDGADFVGGTAPTTFSGTILAGQASATVTINVSGDVTVEGDEAFTLTLGTVGNVSPGVTAAIGTAASATGTILDDDAVAPVPGAFTIADATVTETDAGTAPITFTVTRGSDSNVAASVHYDVTLPGGAGGADAGDFSSPVLSGDLAFAAGQFSKTITLQVAGDNVDEGNETFTVTLSAPTNGATLSDGAATGTIVNDDVPPPPSLSIADAQVVEGNDGTTTLLYTVTASGPAQAGGISFTIATADGTATAASGDYAAQSTTGTIAAGQTSYTFTVAINGDVVAEADETVLVNLSNVTGATIADAQATGTITNDDGAPTTARLFATDFTGFTATGFAPNPIAAQLDSDVFRVVGLSDNGNPDFGGTYTTGDFARGVIAGSTDPTSGGVYSPSANPALVIQPTGSDFSEGAGAIETRIQNTSGFTAVSFDVAFDWTYRNTGDRAEGLQLSYSTDGENFTAVPESAFATPAISDASDAAVFSNQAVRVTIDEVAVANGGFIYLRFNHTSSTGGGNRDEIGIDNLTVDAGLGDASVLTFNDLTVTEGDSGTSIATFTLTRTNSAGAASIAFATANGQAVAGSDYAAQSGTITFADGETTRQIEIAINGDARNESSESFFINLSNPVGVFLPDARARITIANNDTGPAAIPDIQGSGHRSGFVGQAVTTTGIVTAIDSNGFYIQDAAGDDDISTSDGIFVFTSTAPTGIAVGNLVQVSGTVSEFVGGGGSLSVTQITAPTTVVLPGGGELPAPVVIGTGGRLPPTANYEDDNFATFDPATDGLDFYESLEGMRVTVQAPLVVANTNNDGFRETFIVASGGAGATGINDRGGITVSAGDFNPERIQLDVDAAIFASADPLYSQGDRLADVTGILNYAFNTYELLPTAAVTQAGDVTLDREDSFITGGLPNQLTIATYNLENLDPLDTDTGPNTDPNDSARFSLFANDIVNNLNAPDIVGVQEIQDADGTNGGTDYSGTATAQLLIDAIVAAGGPRYRYIEIAPTANDASGGEDNGNIRNGYLYNPDRVTYIEGSAVALSAPVFNGTRKPLAADFIFNGETVTVINVHFTSRRGSNDLQGATQPPVNAGESARIAQAQAVRDFIDTRAAAPGANPEINTVVLGDFNAFYFEESLGRLQAGGAVVNLHELLPVNERYTFLFEGNLQPLDNILASPNLLAGALFDAVHLNSEQPESAGRPTDHDPLLAALRITANDTVSGTAGIDTRVSGAGNDFFFLQQGGDDTARGGADNDAFYYGAALTAADSNDGGEGADIVAIQGNYAGLTLGSGNLVNIETLSVLTGADVRFGDTAGNRYDYDLTSVDANVAAGAKLIVNASTLRAGEDLTFNGSAETNGSFLIYGGMGLDTLTGGSGADVFFMAEGRFSAVDRFTGGAGADIVVLRGDYTVTFAADTLTGIETVTLMSAADTRFFSSGERFSYDVTSADGNVAAGATLTFNGGQLREGETMRFDGGAERDGAFNLFGGADVDVLRGGAGADLIYGGLGGDTLQGNGGNDVFRYQSVAESTSGGRDGILDFAVGDLIDLSRIDAISGTPENDAFSFIGDGVFTGVAGELRAERLNGLIWTVQGDIDGDGRSDIEIIIVATDNDPIIANDFMM